MKLCLTNPLAIDCWGVDQIWIKGDSNEPLPQLVLQIQHPGVIRALILSQDPLVLVEAYLSGLLDFEGNSDDLILLVQQFSQLVIKRSKAVRTWIEALTLPRLPLQLKETSLWKKLKVRTRERDQAAVQHHYDIGWESFRFCSSVRQI